MDTLTSRALPGFTRPLRLRPVAAALACTCLLPATPATARPSAAARVERGIRACVNQERAKRGVRPLKDNPILDRAARFHAVNMARRNFFEHTDPRGRGPAQRVALLDRTHRLYFIGENIAAGYGSAHAACVGWMQSAGHRANILDRDYTVMGAGFARVRGGYGTYFVQDFGRLKPVKPPKPPSSGSGGGSSGGSGGGTTTTHHVVMHLFNVDDQETVYLNGNVVATAGYGKTRDVDLGQLSDSDHVTMMLDNFSGGYAWGITEESDGQTVLDDEAGVAGSYGANGDDQSYTGTVHSVTFDASGTISDSYTVQP